MPLINFYDELEKQTKENKTHYNRLLKLINECTDIICFEHEGRIFKAEKVYAIKEFIKNNPTPEDFNVWLQKNFTELIPIK